MSYQELKQKMIDTLLQKAEAHENEQFEEVKNGFEEMDQKLPRNEGSEYGKVFVAFHFWDGWIDSINHNWQEYYQGIGKSDWPKLAKSLAHTLENDEETSEEIIKEHFDFRNQPPNLFERIKRSIFK